MLQQIRKRPGVYLGKNSLTALRFFLHGYTFRIVTELWMKRTGLDFVTTDYDYFIQTNDISKYSDCLDGLDEFVHAYYKEEITVKSCFTVIFENTSSEEEALDKFYELLDLYFAEQRKSGKLSEAVEGTGAKGS